MSSSSDVVIGGPADRVLRGDRAAQVGPLSTPELRSGTWTRFGGGHGLGDPVTEAVLSDLAETTRAAARAQGYSTGWAEGRREAAAEAAAHRAELELLHHEAEARREAEHRAALDAVQALAEQLAAQLAATTERLESRVVEVALDLTETILGHELSVAADPARDGLRRALALLPDEPVTRVRVSPLDGISDELRDLAGTARIVTDPSLGRGEVVVHADDVVVDARVSGAMARVREALS